MNTRRILAAALATVLLLGAGSAWARGGRVHGGYGGRVHGHVGVYLGAPLFSPFYYSPWPYYGGGYYGPGPWYPPAVVTVPTTPPVYIEQAPQAVAPAPAAQYWYWCADPQGYYPTVPECRQAWTPVLPQPSAPR